MKNIQKISELYTKNGNVNSAILRRDSFKQSILYKNILRESTILDKINPTISQRIRFIKEEMKYIPLCSICKKRFCKFNKNCGDLFLSTCDSILCIKTKRSVSHKHTLEKVLPKIKAKHKNTINKNKLSIIFNLNKGDFVILSIKEIKLLLTDIVKNSNNGVDKNYFYMIHYKNNVNLLCSILYFTQHLLPIPKIKNNIHFNWAERIYIILNDIKKIPICVICNENITSFKNMKDGYRLSCKKRNCFSQLAHISRVKKNKLQIYNKIESCKQFEIIDTFEKFKGLNKTNINIRCKKCQYIFSKFFYNGRLNKDIYCPSCDLIGSSKEEILLYKYIKDKIPNQIQINKNVKILPGKTHNTKREFDLYFPNFNLGIEYNSVYWHSFPRNINKNRHLEKFKLGEKEGIHVLQINSFDWKFNKDIWMDIIKSKLGLLDKIGARKFDIRFNIDNKIKNRFLNDNHLMGEDKSSSNISLYLNNELYAIMTFGKCRFVKEVVLEMHRFCTKRGVSILGGASKLFVNYLNKYKSKKIISYSCNDYSKGELYIKLGFKLDSYTSPNYFYWKNNTILTRYQCQKHKLKDILDAFDDNLSEEMNMISNGFHKYYNSGNKKFIWNLSECKNNR